MARNGSAPVVTKGSNVMDQLEKNIRKHLETICLVPSRHVGSPGVLKTADYIEKVFRDYGFADVSREPFPTTGWRFGSMLFEDLDNGAVPVPTALPCFFSRSAEVSGDPVWLTEDSVAGLTREQVEGKLCIAEYFSEAGAIQGRNGLAELLDRLGAAAAVFISDSAYHTTVAASSKIQRSPNLRNLGAAAVAEEGAYYLARNRNHRYHFAIDADTFPATSYNIVATRPGTGSKRAVFGAHYDAAPLTQAAVDNASGVAALLELARLMKDDLPEWTLEFVALDAEEYCITPGYPAGSEAYTIAHPDRKWEYFMNFDGVGSYFSDSVLHIGQPEKLPKIKSCYEILPIKNGGDDRSFDRIGVPTLWFNVHPRFKDFHTPADTLGTLGIELFPACIRDALQVVHQIAEEQ